MIRAPQINPVARTKNKLENSFQNHININCYISHNKDK